MIEVQWKLTEAFGREVSLVEMFEHPTVRSLAEHVSQKREGNAHAGSQTRAQARLAAVKQRVQKGKGVADGRK